MNLREARERAGLTQDQLATLLKMSSQNYRNYEAGRYMDMSDDLQKKVRKILREEFEYVREDSSRS